MNIIIYIGYVLIGLFTLMMLLYLTMCFTSWITDIIDNQKRRLKK